MHQNLSEQKGVDRLDHLTENKRIVRKFFESVWNEGDFSIAEEHWSPAFKLHFRGEEEILSLEGLRAEVEFWRKAFPDIHCIVEDLIAEADRVAVRLTFLGTHTGAEMFGLQPSGKAFTITEQTFVRFEEGKMVEAWEDYDEYGLRQQLGGGRTAQQ